MSSSLLTVPNALTFLRFCGIPLFIYLTLNLHANGWAVFVLAIGGATDYFDGKLARAWGQTSRFGEIADPAIDRLYIFAILIVFLIQSVVPLWMIAALIIRDLFLAVVTISLKLYGYGVLQVTYLGKAATFNLMYAFPFLLLAHEDNALGVLAFVIGWSFAIWGVALYISTGINYSRRAISTIRGGHVNNS
jgi:cardiolipin synthase (CMP-forming)